MEKEDFIEAVELLGVDHAVMEWILHSTEEDFMHLWPLMEQEHNKIINKKD